MPVPALKGLTMRAPMVSVFVFGGIVALGCLLALPASAQDPTPRPAVQDGSIKPIGKVVSAKGVVTVEHVNAMVVQAALGSNSGQTKIGDPIYLGDIVQTGADGRLGVTFTDGTAFDLSSNARMVMTEFVYDPNSQTNSTLLSLTITRRGPFAVSTPSGRMPASFFPSASTSLGHRIPTAPAERSPEIASMRATAVASTTSALAQPGGRAQAGSRRRLNVRLPASDHQAWSPRPRPRVYRADGERQVGMAGDGQLPARSAWRLHGVAFDHRPDEGPGHGVLRIRHVQ